ncbi:MAG: lysophospholipid acyltransferase family protein [Patescibacteria group bacterium]|jgi:1-acyl-sn-glycerol-3-phosphate acyltransferase
MADQFLIAKENTFRGKFLYRFLRIFVAPLIRLIWIKEVKGLSNLPKSGAYIIAANHQSYLDFLCLQAVLPVRLTFLAAEKFYSSGFWRPIVELTGQIRVERNADDKTEVIAKALEVLNRGRVLAIFPQGTRSRSGQIEKTYTGVARFALGAGAPVIPVGIKGAYEVLPPWEKCPKLRKIIKINIGEPVNLSEYSKRPIEPETYRKATNEAMKKIAELARLEYKEE